MNIHKDQIIGELVAQDYRTATIFKKYGIDFCCLGSTRVNEACDKKGIDTSLVLNDLNSAMQTSNNGAIDYQTWPLDLLVDYIVKKHHRYVEEKSLEIKPYLDKIRKVHGGRHPELHEINEHFLAGAGMLAQHMKKEELVLFPFIRKMVAAKQNGTKLEPPHFGTIANPINNMMSEHTTEGDRFRRIEELTNGYTPPADGCNTYRVTFGLLKEFEEDLHMHIHLENNILFPKSIELEKELLHE
ncbi:MAG: iron-sulfur cluster repair di-iron protein [Bacteroidales bacterium]|jgi:regulator of cell morphogenesis and NO signaling|nr:iron-sulfur cluster repair di-iron protein [Bacteroidales bacterium]